MLEEKLNNAFKVIWKSNSEHEISYTNNQLKNFQVSIQVSLTYAVSDRENIF